MLHRRFIARILMFFFVAAFCATCLGQDSNRHVAEITGAGSLETFLDDNLEIRQHSADADMTSEEWQRLIGITPQKIRDLLATEGYFSSTVTYETATESDRSVARFLVTLGPVTQVEAVDIRFTGTIATGPGANAARMENLRGRWALQAGTEFRQQAWTDAKNALLKALLVHDFPSAAITQSEAKVDPRQHAAVLTIDIDSGPYFTFGALQIEGLKRYSREMIDQLNPIQPGERYSQAKLTELQARLQDSGYFRSVFATIEPDPQHPDNVPIRVDLNENERRRLSFGTGFSTDTGARVQMKWLDRQFLGHNWRSESELRVDRQTRTLGSDLYFPAWENGWHPSLGTHYERTDIASEIDDKIRVDARLTSPKREDERVWATSYLADRQRIADVSVNHRQALIAAYTYTRRRVDNLLSPQRGYVASIELDGGVAGLLNEKNMTRAVGHANWLLPLGKTWLAVFRGQIGEVYGATRQQVPEDLLFRTGGDQTVRGYAYNSLGVAQNGAVVGGTVVGVVSAELVYKITPTWGAAVFRDAGDAANTWRDFKLKQGTGIGARWRSPIGPVNLDLAYGHAVNKVRLHFSVGYGF